MELLITNVPVIGSRTRAEREAFGLILTFLCQNGPLLWSGSHFMTWKHHLGPYKPYLGSFDESRVVRGQQELKLFGYL